ncbi:CLUMA_CG020222, isoform A [Clunio marinus]|uniref:CLUMA_CG020222, isoform A n=1 Tax=Clunio marinus TaxID=568069 RepID=A0A1J1J5L1_9DIPT|nr:CLUMA_CG020222, isoform A [Clunio marinus]
MNESNFILFHWIQFANISIKSFIQMVDETLWEFNFLLFYFFFLLFSLIRYKTLHELTSFHPCMLRAHVRLRALKSFRRFTARYNWYWT